MPRATPAEESTAAKKSAPQKKLSKSAAKTAKGKAATKMVSDSGKGRAADIEKFLKGNEAMLGDINRPIDFISTGSWVVDRIIGDGLGENGAGGIPKGFMAEVFGKEGCGKTTLALQTAAECQREGGLVLFVDFEKSLRAQRHYVKSLGIDINDKSKFIHLEPDTLEDGAKATFEAIVALRPDLVIIDSVAAMIPSAFLTGDVEDAIKVGLHARLIGIFVGTLNKVLQKSNTAVLFTNQLRAKIGGMGNGPQTDTTGGMAFKFYMHLRLQMAVVSKTSSSQVSEITGKAGTSVVSDQVVKVTAVKNKMDKPFKSEEVYITFGKGMDGLRSLIELAIKRGVLKGSGWYEYISKEDSGYNFKIQGVAKVKAHLEQHPEVVEDMMPRLFPEVDVEAFVQAREAGEIDKDDMGDEMADLLNQMAANMSSVSANPSLPGESDD